MSQKRNPDEFGSGKMLGGNNTHSPDDKRRRLHSFRSVVREVMTQKRIERAFEPMLRRVVKEEVESALKKHVVHIKRHSEEDGFPSESKSLQLKFLGALSLPVFTGSRIEVEDSSAIRVALLDAFTGEVVQYAPESFAKVEIVVLEGDFDSDEKANWTLEEFKNNIVRERQGKKPLLTGDVRLCLKDGIVSIGEISFTDNSSWTRSRRFRLGARVVGDFDGARIKEAKTESFIVRDHRGELYKKHHPPSLSDEVWRLEKIGKDGAFHKRLSSVRVKTVRDFLTWLHLEPVRLRNILGTGMSAKMWEVTVDHARTCILNERVHLYHSSSSQHEKGVVFNLVGQALGLYSESQYIPVNKISQTDKDEAQSMVRYAFQHWDQVFLYEDLNSLLGNSPYTASSSGTITPDERKASKSENINPFNYTQPGRIPSPDMLQSMYSLGFMSSSEDYSLQSVDTFDIRFDQPLDPFLSEPDYIMEPFHGDEHLEFLDIDQSFQSIDHPPQPSDHTIGRPRTRWRILSIVVRWLMGRTDRQEI